MALADAVQGAKRPSQQITWQDQDGNAVDLSGATITARIRNQATGVVRAADGTFTLITPTAGVFRWDYGTNDVGTAGHFVVQFTAAYGSGTTPGRTITGKWTVHEFIEVAA